MLLPHQMGLSAAALRRSRVQEPKGMERLVEEIRKDPQFVLAEKTLRALVEAITVTIEVQGDDKAQALADNLTKRWEESRSKALEAIAYGRQAFERWYEWDATAGIMAVAPMTAIPFERSELCLGEDGAIGVKVTPKGDAIHLEPDRVWWCGLDATEIVPHGRSRFLGAPLEVWRDRRALEKQAEAWRLRYALGTGVIYGPSEDPSARKLPIKGEGTAGELDQNGRPVDPLEDIRLMLMEKESGAWLIFGSERDENGNRLYEVTQFPEVKDASAIDSAFKRLDDAALAAMGIPPRAITQDSSTGSLAMSQAHLAVLKNTVQGILFQLIASYQKHVIDPAINANWPGVNKPTLTMMSQPVDDALRAIINTAVQQIMVAPQVSPLITEGVIDLARMLEIAGVPMGEDLQRKMDRIRISAIPIPAMPVGPAPSIAPVPTAAPSADPTTAAVAGGDATVQDTALNGAQIASLLEVVGQIVAKQLPAEGGREILKQAFPLMDPTAIDKIIQSVAKFQPSQVPAAQGAAMATALGVARINFATKEPPADAVSPEELLQRSQDELSAFWPRLTRALSNREALPRGVLRRPPA